MKKALLLLLFDYQCMLALWLDPRTAVHGDPTLYIYRLYARTMVIFTAPHALAVLCVWLL